MHRKKRVEKDGEQIVLVMYAAERGRRYIQKQGCLFNEYVLDILWKHNWYRVSVPGRIAACEMLDIRWRHVYIRSMA